MVTVLSFLVLSPITANADAGNPILGAIRGSIRDNPDGTATVFVRGQWNWLSHNTDCNFDRAGTGVAIAWSDPTEPGFVVDKANISVKVGIASLRAGDTRNTIDRMIHPVDRGNRAEGYTVAGTDFPAGQRFVDPTPPRPTRANVAAWRGGCGRQPLSATASRGTNPDRSHRRCATGTTACAGNPWGSWGYEKNSGKGYSHTFASREDISKVCVIFYDVHGGGTKGSGDFQHVLAGNTSQIAVNGNKDNSVSTNRFNPHQGANCVGFPFLDHTTATDVTVGGNIHDTAFIHGAALGQVTFVQFHLFADPTCSGPDLYTGARKQVTGNGSVVSNNFQTTGSGDYRWTADLFDAANGGKLLYSSQCNDPGETSTVGNAGPEVTTDAGDNVVFAGNPPGNNLSDTATLSGGFNPTGTMTFSLYGPNDPNCSNAPVGTDSKTVNGNGQYTGTVHITAPGVYRWIANYSGDANNDPTANECNEANENLTVINPSIKIEKDPDTPAVVAGDTATFTIVVTNTGDVTLANVSVTDAQAPGCARANLGSLAPGASTTYTCTTPAINAPLDNVAEVCADPPTGPEVCDDDHGQVGLLHLSSRQDFAPRDFAVISLTGSGIQPLNGHITFRLYKGACTGANQIYTETVNVAGDGTYASSNVTPLLSALNNTKFGDPDTDGAYNWDIDYSGDTNGNAAINGACGTESFTVTNGADA
jgi:uncharacterized repeat protein (TIGR01451 family)